MKAFLKKNKIAYFILFVILFLFTALFLRAWPNRELQRQIAVGFGVSYFVWGVIAHAKSKRINSEIVFEYLAIALLAVLMIVLITL
jgi:hypothetical protein